MFGDLAIGGDALAFEDHAVATTVVKRRSMTASWMSARASRYTIADP
jgi:hypothetical protein